MDNLYQNMDLVVVCERCGRLLEADEIEAGERVCLECLGAEIQAEIRLESPLLAIVRARLAEISPPSIPPRGGEGRKKAPKKGKGTESK